MGVTADGAHQVEKNFHLISTVGSTRNLVEIGQVVSEELLNNIMILYMYTAHGQWKITLADKKILILI